MMPGWPAWLKPALVGALGGPGESRALYRPYRFVKATPLNRRSFVRFLREGLGGIEAPEETVATAHDLHSLVQRFRTRPAFVRKPKRRQETAQLGEAGGGGTSSRENGRFHRISKLRERLRFRDMKALPEILGLRDFGM